MPKNYNVSLKVDPLVKRWMDNRFKFRRGIYFLGNSCYYGLVSALLYQSQVKGPKRLPDKYSNFVPVRIGISEYDFYHYGWEVSPMQEIRFSRLVRNIVIDECLRSVALLRASFSVPLSQAINAYTIYYNIADEDIHYETLRKIYQRKYRRIEEEYRAFNQAAVTDFGTRDEQPPKRILRLHRRRAEAPNQMELPL